MRPRPRSAGPRLVWTRVGTTATAVILLWACQDAPEPFTPPERAPLEGPAWQLTFNPGDDRAPTWSTDGQRVIYSAEGLDDDTLDMRGILVSVPFEGGRADRVFPEVQRNDEAERWLTTPMESSADDRLVFAHIIRYQGTLCGVPAFIVCSDATVPALTQPRLDSIAFRVRGPDDSGSLSSNTTLGIKYAGRSFDPSQQVDGLLGVWQIELYPFQRVHAEEGALIFRPSWSPDGRLVAVSDGLQILVWDPQAGTVTPVPGTADGVTPAWSPDGEWIAFVRLERSSSRTDFCRHFITTSTGLVLGCAEERTEYDVGRRIVTLVRPDGSELREVAEGEEPAWMPDGEQLVIRYQDQLWRADADGGSLALISNTEGGREPAVSPDGRYLAFARRDVEEDEENDVEEKYSIWVVRLEL